MSQTKTESTRQKPPESLAIKLANPEKLPEMPPIQAKATTTEKEVAETIEAIKLADLRHPIKLTDIAAGTVVLVDDQEKPIAQYLTKAEQAYKFLNNAEAEFNKATEYRKELLKQSTVWKAAPKVTEAYCQLGDALLALEKLVAAGQLTPSLYEHWWKDELGIRDSKRSRAKDLA